MHIVYWCTSIKPAPEVILEIGFRMLTEVIPAQEVQAQALASPPRKTDRGSTAACYKLSDDGIELFRTGILGAPEGFKEWPSEVPEPDFDIYPLTENAVLAIHHGN